MVKPMKLVTINEVEKTEINDECLDTVEEVRAYAKKRAMTGFAFIATFADGKTATGFSSGNTPGVISGLELLKYRMTKNWNGD